MSLRFSFEQMERDISAFAALSKDFVASEAQHVLPRFVDELRTYRHQATNTATSWQMREDSPLLTVISDGRFEKGKKKAGGIKVFAEVSSIWEIRRERPKKSSQPARYFQLVGNASTVVRLKKIVEGASPLEIAMWRMEVGDASHPGCHFHTQIRGETDDPPFPSSVPVPRLPTFLLTPTAVVEFVLSELFQDEWGQEIARQKAQLDIWAPIQKSRLERLLTWKRDTVLETNGSPWCWLKAAKPSDDLLI